MFSKFKTLQTLINHTKGLYLISQIHGIGYSNQILCITLSSLLMFQHYFKGKIQAKSPLEGKLAPNRVHTENIHILDLLDWVQTGSRHSWGRVQTGQTWSRHNPDSCNVGESKSIKSSLTAQTGFIPSPHNPNWVQTGSNHSQGQVPYSPNWEEMQFRQSEKSPNTVHTVKTYSGHSLDWAKNKFRQSLGPGHGFCCCFVWVLVLVCPQTWWHI